MDPDNNEPAGAVVPEGRARRELTALETRRIISELLLRVQGRADLTNLTVRSTNGRVKNVSCASADN
jgi:hypothetical protein